MGKKNNKGPGRPVDLEKKLAIIKAASDLFLELGYVNTSMEKVALKAGISKQTVYRNFQNKENLFRATIVHVSNKISPPIEILAKKGTMREILFELGIKFLDLILCPINLGMYQTMVSERGKHVEAAKIYFDEGPKRFIQALADYLAKKTQEGMCSVNDPQRAASHFFCMVRGINLFAILIGVIDNVPENERVQHVHSVVDTIAKCYNFSE